MYIKTNIPEELVKAENKIKSLDQQIIGEGFVPDKIELSEDDRKAVIDALARWTMNPDRANRGPIPEYPPEMKIEKEEVMTAIIKKFLNQKLGLER